MPQLTAEHLFTSGRSHGLSAALLYQAAIEEGQERLPEDPERFAFNGSYSLSIYNLTGLAFELMLKAAFVALGGDGDERTLRGFGHNLCGCLDAALAQGFVSQAPKLHEIVGVMDVPFRAHFFRYRRPDQFGLPEMQHVIECFAVLDDELRALVER